MDSLIRNVTWYQSKIGEHDKQSWEQTVEGKILTNIENLPKKDATKERRELLDIDLIKGSTFTKAKPSHTSYIRTWKGLIRGLFLPFFYKWWIEHTSLKFLIGALFLYVAQILVTAIYFRYSDVMTSNTSLFEVTNPLMFMFVLSVIHTQIVFTQSSKKHKIFSSATPSFAMPRNAIKRVKKMQVKVPKPTKRKPKSQLSRHSESKSEDLPKPLKKVSSDSSEEVDEALLRNEGDFVETTDLLEAMEEDGVSSEESITQEVTPESQRFRVEFVPDVAADAEEKNASIHLLANDQSGKMSLSLKGMRELESEGTSDMDSPMVACTSDTEWETNRVCNSDVAGESSSEYESGYDKDEEPSVEGPICLKPKVSHTLAYVPSVYDRISCIVWEKDECKKVELSVPDIGGLIERQVASLEYEPTEVFYTAIIFTSLIACFPFLYRFYYSDTLRELVSEAVINQRLPEPQALHQAATILCGSTWQYYSMGITPFLTPDSSHQEYVIVANGFIQRISLCSLFSFLVIVAEKSYWQRLLYAKFFCCLTSARKSKKYAVPHFRLNKVKNIKIWLSLRAYLKKRGPQRSVEVIVGAVFILMVAFLAVMCIQLLNDISTYLQIYGNWELTLCCMALTCYLLRFYSLGTKVAKKYKSLSILITEQINLYLHMEQKPHKKEELLVASSVLKLAEGLIKEIESPYKMSSTVINPVVFNVTRLMMLSAFSAIVSELLGFKLKLYKVKL